jgi:hypothetical protein
MLREIINAVCVKEHKNNWSVLAEPTEELQNSSAVPIAVSHQQVQNLADVLVLQPS